MEHINFTGSMTALITPMNEDGSLDLSGLRRFVEWQIEQGTSALVPAGTTGESPTLSHAEHRSVVTVAVETAAGRVPVLAGAGSNSTFEALDMARHAKEVGASGALVVVPYYNKPTQEGLYRHYMTIADSVDLPIIIYNIPGRSIVDMSVATMARLAVHPNIVGVKDSTADLMRPLLTRRAIAKRFNQLSGEDGTAVSFLAAGGDGCISVTSNVAPALCAQMHKAWQDGATSDAMALQDQLVSLHNALFCESNPGPVKYAAKLLGLCGDTCRLPLAPIADTSREMVRAALADVGLLG